MTVLTATTLLSLADQLPLTLDALMARCSERLCAGQRLLSLYGRAASAPQAPGTLVTAVFHPAGGALEVLRAWAPAHASYQALTPQHPVAHIFERELWEQTGLQPQGHPWLKPVRFEGARQEHVNDYPFFKVRGAGVHEVGVGPVHAGVIEPGHFRFMCQGETVHHLEIQLGYQHRAVEQLLLQRPAWRLTPLVESIVGDSAIAYAWGHCEAMECLAGMPVDLVKSTSRAVALELERLAMHVATLNGLATDIAYLQASATYGRLRTAIINASQRVCGNRFGRGWIRPGGARTLTPSLRHDLMQTLLAFQRDFAPVNRLMRSARSVRARFLGTGILDTPTASALGLTGVVARASGVALDARSQWPGPVYGQHPLPMVTETSGDCWARMRLRMREADASVQWLLQVLGDDSLWGEDRPLRPSPAADPPLQAHALCVTLIEGVRGPVLQALETQAAGQLVHYKVQDPSMANWFGLAMALRQQGISDFPICNKSFDLSYCGNDL